MSKNRRRKFLVDKKVQVKYATFIVVLLFVYTLVLLSVIFAPHAMVLFSDTPPPEQAAAAEVVLLLNSYIWPWVILLMILCGVYSIFITHKIAGPVFVFNRMTKAIGRGDFSLRANLRDGDDLLDLAENLNQMADSLEMDMKEIEAEHKKIAACCTGMEALLQSGETKEEDVRELFETINLASGRLNAISCKCRFRDEE